MRKLCVECKYYKYDGMAMGPICRHPNNYAEPDPVFGHRALVAGPTELRKQGGACGPDGKWWLKKTGWVHKARRFFS